MVTAADFISAGRNFKRLGSTLFGSPINIRSLTGTERDLLRSRAADKNPLTAAELVAMATVDDAGAPVFTLEQAAELGACDGGEVDRLAVEILDLSGLHVKAEANAAKN